MKFLNDLQFILETGNYRIDWGLTLAITTTVSLFYIFIDVFSFEAKILKILKDGLD